MPRPSRLVLNKSFKRFSIEKISDLRHKLQLPETGFIDNAKAAKGLAQAKQATEIDKYQEFYYQSVLARKSILWTYVLFCSLNDYYRLVLDFVPFNTHHRSITLLAMVENEFGLCEKDICRIFEISFIWKQFLDTILKALKATANNEQQKTIAAFSISLNNMDVITKLQKLYQYCLNIGELKYAEEIKQEIIKRKVEITKELAENAFRKKMIIWKSITHNTNPSSGI